MSTVTWPERFMSNFTVTQIDRMDYFTSAPGMDGTFSCKVCGPAQSGSREKHYEQHSRELAWFVKAREEKIKEERRNRLHPNSSKSKQVKGEFYEKPCVSCGQQIPRSGKRGAPPKKCDSCKGVVAAPTNKVTCKHTKSDGSTCGMKPLKDGEFCRWHQSK